MSTDRAWLHTHCNQVWLPLPQKSWQHFKYISTWEIPRGNRKNRLGVRRPSCGPSSTNDKLWPWASHYTFLGLHFLICKIKMWHWFKGTGKPLTLGGGYLPYFGDSLGIRNTSNNLLNSAQDSELVFSKRQHCLHTEGSGWAVEEN